MSEALSMSAPLQARLAAVNKAIGKQQKIRDHAPRGSKQRRRAVRNLRTLNRRREQLRADRWRFRGSTAIVKYEVIPILVANEAPPTSRKRWNPFGNTSSDHWLGNKDADAVDGATHANNDELGSKVKAALLDDPDATMDGFTEFTITRSHTGKEEVYRVQIITEEHGTGPHIHIGIKRVSP